LAPGKKKRRTIKEKKRPGKKSQRREGVNQGKSRSRKNEGEDGIKPRIYRGEDREIKNTLTVRL